MCLSENPEVCVLEQIQMHQMPTFKLSDSQKENWVISYSSLKC